MGMDDLQEAKQEENVPADESKGNIPHHSLETFSSSRDGAAELLPWRCTAGGPGQWPPPAPILLHIPTVWVPPVTPGSSTPTAALGA